MNHQQIKSFKKSSRWNFLSSIMSERPTSAFPQQTNIRISENLSLSLYKFGPGSLATDLLHGDKTTDLAEQLVKHCWGCYIALIRNLNDGSYFFLPDPMHSVRLYYKRESNGSISLDTDLRNLVDRGAIEWNTSYLLSFAKTQFGISGQTPFKDIEVVPVGHALLIENDGSTAIKQIWPLTKFAARDELDQITDSAMSEVCQTITKDCDNFVLALSGGVDSTSVAIFLNDELKKKKEKLRSYNYFSTLSPKLNESELAKQVNAAISGDLICMDIGNYLPFADLSPKRPPETLNMRGLFIGLDKMIDRNIGSEALIIEGQGGDTLFWASPESSIIHDSYSDNGIAFALQTAKKLSILRNDSLPRLLYSCLGNSLGIITGQQHNNVSMPDVKNMFNSSREKIVRNSLVDKMEIKGKHYPALYQHIENFQYMLEIQSTPNDPGYCRRIQPFLQQPIVEASLLQKSYNSFDTETDRSLLRRIAKRRKNIPVLNRRNKGGFDAGMIRGLQVHRDQIKELILNGVLVRSNLLDLDMFNENYKRVEVGMLSAGMAISLLVCVEIYCSAWENW